MHRHGYIGRKFGRERDQRNALKRGLMISLVESKSIKTTLPKAKELRRPMEKLISIAKKGDLASRRRLIAEFGGNLDVAGQLMEMAKSIKRDSGYLRVVKLDEWRVGDHAPMAKIEFVDEFDKPEVEKTEATEAKPVKKPTKATAKKSETTVTKKTAPKTKKEDK